MGIELFILPREILVFLHRRPPTIYHEELRLTLLLHTFLLVAPQSLQDPRFPVLTRIPLPLPE
jgi:hypothetical protein